MTEIRLYLATDAPEKACLMVFHRGLYGLPEWAAVADSVAAIEAIPAGSRVQGYWFTETLDSIEMQEAYRRRWQSGAVAGMTAEFAAQLDDWCARRDAAEAALIARPAPAVEAPLHAAGGRKWS
ncbi:hypothetical protein [Martelella sp. HB161492]|uniref:hypothetical protein n=1 Tax=Martelella sp. HB161492 TaxID=2720726 RepID=UPI0015917341|nr:hypothetical protein [Martelella sp. HB161492]